MGLIISKKHAKTCQRQPRATLSPEILLAPLPMPPASSVPRRHSSSPPCRSSRTPPRRPSRSTSRSPSCSPPELLSFNNAEYRPIPDDQTIVHHPSYDLPRYGISINLRLRCLVCLNCNRAIDCDKMIDHLKKDLPLVEVPSDLPATLQTAYNLVTYTNVKYPEGPIPPVYGILLEPQQAYFCDCGHGNHTLSTLRIHQNRTEERPCPRRLHNPRHHIGYAQRLTNNRRLFEVDISMMRPVSDDDTHYPLAYRQSLPALREYSKLEIKGAEDEMNVSSFFYKERWLDHLKGYTPEDIMEVCKDVTTEFPLAGVLRKVAYEFLRRSNELIKRHSSFGLPRAMGQTTERDTLYRFDWVTEPTLQKYSLTLHRLVLGVLRQMDPGYSHKYRFPSLHATQLVPFEALSQALVRGPPVNELIDLYESACFSLFAHHQHEYETSRKLDQFFSPAICFLVVHSVKEGGGFKMASMISQIAAHLMFSVRAVVIDEVTRKALRDGIGFFKCVLFLFSACLRLVISFPL